MLLSGFNISNKSDLSSQDELKSAYKIPLVVLMCIVSLVAVLGNSLVIIAMITTKRLRTVSNTFILSLSISDFMVGLFVMPISLSIYVYDRWVWGRVICNSWLSIDYIASTASIFNLFALSIERYLSITQPLKYISYQSKSKAKLVILFVWLISSLWIFPINLWNLEETIFQKYRKHRVFDPDAESKCVTDFETNKIFKIATTLFNFYVPMIGIILIYYKIFMTIIKRSKSEVLYLNDLAKEKNAAASFSRPRTKSEAFISTINRSELNSSSDKLNLNSDKTITESISQAKNSIAKAKPSYDTATEEQKNPSKVLTVATKKENQMRKSKTIDFFQLDKKRNRLNELNVTVVKPQQVEPPKKSKFSDTKFTFGLFKFDKNLNEDCLTTRRNAVSELVTSIDNRNLDRTNTRVLNNRKRELSELSSGVESSEAKRSLVQRLFFRGYKKKSFSLRLKQQIKAAKQLGLLLLAFLATWMPYFIIFIVVAFCHDCVSENVSTLTVWLGYLNSSINPILYPLCNSGFKNAFRRLLHLPNKKRNRKDTIYKSILFSTKNR